MKYISEFRDSKLSKTIADAMMREADPQKTYHFMEFCGGHTHAIYRYGIKSLLPKNVKMVHGPGCPVCVLPIARIDLAVELAKKPNVILCTYGDLMRVPGSSGLTLQKAQAQGSQIQMIYSTLDSLKIAQENPDKEVILFAIGFETTTPPTAMALKQALKLNLKNFSVVSNHVLTPAALKALLSSGENKVRIDGFVGPAHVSTVIGTRPYEFFAREYKKPIVIAGFEPLDVMQSILMLIRQANRGAAEVENEYTRVVTPEGNLKAQKMVDDFFELRESFDWRGLGSIPKSGLKIRSQFSEYDAEERFQLQTKPVEDHKGCECGLILQGIKQPHECKLFDKVCSPEHPVGACMVSSEGACAAYYNYGRFT